MQFGYQMANLLQMPRLRAGIFQATGKFFLKRNDAGATSCAIRDDNLRIFNNPVL